MPTLLLSPHGTDLHSLRMFNDVPDGCLLDRWGREPSSMSARVPYLLGSDYGFDETSYCRALEPSSGVLCDICQDFGGTTTVALADIVADLNVADEKILLPLLLAAGVALLCGLVTMIVFGCTTVRRLRKHPELRASFGWQPLPGFATVQAAMALTLPRSFARVLVMSPLRSLLADPQALHRHTSPWEHRLARFAYLNLLAFLLMAVFFSELQDRGAVAGAAIVAGCTAICVLTFGALPSLLTFVEIRRVRRLKTRGSNKLDQWWAEFMESLK